MALGVIHNHFTFQDCIRARTCELLVCETPAGTAVAVGLKCKVCHKERIDVPVIKGKAHIPANVEA